MSMSEMFARHRGHELIALILADYYDYMQVISGDTYFTQLAEVSKN